MDEALLISDVLPFGRELGRLAQASVQISEIFLFLVVYQRALHFTHLGGGDRLDREGLASIAQFPYFR